MSEGGGGGGGGGNWRNLDFRGGGGHDNKDVTKFHKCHLGGRGMLEYVCVCVCVCRVSYRDLGEGQLQSSLLMWSGCIAHNNWWVWGHAPAELKKYI